MFGFPFFTSLIVTVAMVVGFSFIINHGIQKRKDSKDTTQTDQGKKAKTVTHKAKIALAF